MLYYVIGKAVTEPGKLNGITKANQYTKFNMYTDNDVEDILSLVESGITYHSIGEKYGVTGGAIRQLLKREGYNLPKRREINPLENFNRGKIQYATCINCGRKFIKYLSTTGKYCSNKCQHEKTHKDLYARFVKGDEYFMRPNYNPIRFKPDILKEQNYKGDICGCEVFWNGKPLVFILDHIDGDASNNIRSNVRLVCPNCDSQLDTYKSKNKKGKRVYYRKGQKIINDK